MRARLLAWFVALLLASGGVRAAGPALDSAVMVEAGYRMDVISQTMSHEYDNWTLFADGSAYKALPPAALADFDVAASRGQRPAAWGEWRREGERLEVRWPNAGAKGGEKAADWTAPRKWFALTVPDDGLALDALYTMAGVASQGGLSDTTFATGWKEIRFHPDGRFEQSAGGSVSSNQGNTSLVTRGSRASAGRYRITGPMLELRYDDGRAVRASLFFSSADRKTMLLNGARLRKR